MTLLRSREVRLVRIPTGLPSLDDFAVVEVEVGDPAPGEAIVRNAYCSVDPFMRMMMSTVRPVADRPASQAGAPLAGGAVGQVVASRARGIAEGDWVVHQSGWREIARIRIDDDGVRGIDAAAAPVSTALGVLGMPGLTAWYGMQRFGRPRENETVYVSAAAGTVGSLAAQLAAGGGSRVICSAGSQEKLAWLAGCGLDAQFNYREQPVDEALPTLAPDGIDLYFDNVGGGHLQAALDNMAFRGRIVACGAVSLYNDERATPGPANLDLLFTKELTIQGVRSRAHRDCYPEFLEEVTPLVASGSIRYAETTVSGIENAPAAFIGLFSGENLGKMLIEVAPA
ncbi:MAG: NADP-dependent oxidoreductase [Actinomycetia bacterium]|nr:NADP-dependent oxidoreductase [Actinomycetes bacterium]